MADFPRPDLVPAITPDPRRGFTAQIFDAAIVKRVQSGNHTLEAKAVRGDGSLCVHVSYLLLFVCCR